MSRLEVYPQTRRINKLIAHKAAHEPGFQAQGPRLAAEIRASIGAHSRTGAFAGSVHVEHGSTDLFVYSDPTPPGRAHAELGHETPAGNHVAGIHAIGAVVRAHGGV